MFHTPDHEFWLTQFIRQLAVRAVIVVVLGIPCGCATVFTQPVATATQPIPWLANFAAPPVESTPPFDLGQIQPVPRTGIATGDLLEITIWDLYEPGKPHTFPTRVDAQGQVVVPMLEPVRVEGIAIADVEAQLCDAYRSRELLRNPQILVRGIDSATRKIYVTGAVLRPGLIDLPAQDPSVFAALVAAGGLSRGAGLHIFVSERSPKAAGEGQVQASIEDELAPEPQVANNAGLSLPADASAATQQASGGSTMDASGTINATRQLDDSRILDASSPAEVEEELLSNRSGTISVGEGGKPTSPPTATDKKSGVVESIATRPDLIANAPVEAGGRWYDLSVDHDRDDLRKLELHDGDLVSVRPAAPPVRITGAVNQPGTYRAPASNSLTLNDALQLAGGFPSLDRSMVIVLTRPANSEHGLQRWTYRVGQGEKLPANLPYVQPGDLVHVEPTAQARVQSLVDAVLPRRRT